jgi:hypothetical protein
MCWITYLIMPFLLVELKSSFNRVIVTSKLDLLWVFSMVIPIINFISWFIRFLILQIDSNVTCFWIRLLSSFINRKIGYVKVFMGSQLFVWVSSLCFFFDNVIKATYIEWSTSSINEIFRKCIFPIICLDHFILLTLHLLLELLFPRGFLYISRTDLLNVEVVRFKILIWDAVVCTLTKFPLMRIFDERWYFRTRDELIFIRL